MASFDPSQRPRRDSADGRTLRGARNRQAILDAAYDLVKEQHRPPSIEEVAQRAGVGMRTDFRHFDDFDSLYSSMRERVAREVLARVAWQPPTCRLEEDLTALIGRRARIFEHVTPFRRAARFLGNLVQEQEARVVQVLRSALSSVVEPHLGPGAQDTLEALDALLSFETWERLRHTQNVSVKRAERVLLRAALTLVRSVD